MGFFMYYGNESSIREKSIVVHITMIKNLFMIVGVARADLDHCGKMPAARDELNRSARDGKI